MSLTHQDKQDIAAILDTIVKRAVEPIQAEVKKHGVLLEKHSFLLENQGALLKAQGVLLEASEERGNMALNMLSAQLASELKSNQNETRIEYLESGHKVLQATVKYHQQLLKARPAL